MSNRVDDWLPTRHTLINRLKNLEDDRSWREFFEIYGKLIYGVALRSGLAHAEAEDVVQETVLSVSRKIEKFKADPALGSFKAWLGQLIRWRIADRIRKRRKDDPGIGGAVSPREPGLATSTAPEERIPDPAGNGFDLLWDEEWRRQLMEAAIDRLKSKVNARHYQIFQMHVLKEHNAAEVAQAFDVSTDQVHLIKHRLRKLLQDELTSLEKAHR